MNGRRSCRRKYPLEWDQASVEKDARLILGYFGNYEGAFEGDVPMLQRDYFTFMAWLYFSPFICDLRSLAHLQDSDVVRYPSFAIIFGKSNCGKTSLVDTLITSMFGRAHTVEKRSFTTARLRGLQHAYKRHPVVFDDIGRRAFNTHGKELIKDEYPPQVTEYPGFVLSMNAEPHSFPGRDRERQPDRLPTTPCPHDEKLRHASRRGSSRSRGATGHLYRRYLVDVMGRLERERLPEDWLATSSERLSGILAEHRTAPRRLVRESTGSVTRQAIDRVRARVLALLRRPALAKRRATSERLDQSEGNDVGVWNSAHAFAGRDSAGTTYRRPSSTRPLAGAIVRCSTATAWSGSSVSGSEREDAGGSGVESDLPEPCGLESLCSDPEQAIEPSSVLESGTR